MTVADFFRNNKWAFPVIIACVVIAIATAVFMNLRPAQGTWRYGMCRSFLDFEYAYPPTIDVMTVVEERSAARLFVAETNPFGNERIVQVDCEYQIDGSRVSLIQLSLDRKPIPPMRLAYYNRLIPTLMTQKMDLDLPKPLPRGLNELKR